MVFMLAAAILSKSCHASDATAYTAPKNTTDVNADQSNSNTTESPSPTNQSNDAKNADDEDDYMDLANMMDQELEEICTSRGFELVRETDVTTGESLVYTHQDYVDAASECLQIEADL